MATEPEVSEYRALTTLVTVVIATRNRASELRRTLTRLSSLPRPPSIIVVDNASDDATRQMVREEFPAVRLIALQCNAGAAGRNAGARAAATPFVAFSDDDSWWHPGSLERCLGAFGSHAGLGLVAARTVVGSGQVEDPLNALMRHSPLGADGMPGPRILGFLACSAVVRRAAFLEAGGFSPLLFFGCEEALLAMDLVATGWALAYLDDVVAEHWPSASRDPVRGLVLRARNNVLIAWLRRPLWVALRRTAGLACRAATDRVAARALGAVCRDLSTALRQRRPLPDAVEQQLRLLEMPDRTVP